MQMPLPSGIGVRYRVIDPPAYNQDTVMGEVDVEAKAIDRVADDPLTEIHPLDPLSELDGEENRIDRATDVDDEHFLPLSHLLEYWDNEEENENDGEDRASSDVMEEEEEEEAEEEEGGENDASPTPTAAEPN